MRTFQRMTHDDGSIAIWLNACTVPAADEVVEGLGLNPSGYFWNGVAERLMAGPLADIADVVETDPEGDTFVARSMDGGALLRLEAAMDALLGDPDALHAFVEAALADDFEFDD